MKKEILLPALAVAGGAAGFGLRRWELATAFEPDTGLPIAGMPATWALLALSAGMILLLAVLCRESCKGLPGREGDGVFYARDNTLYAVAGILSAFLLLGAAAAIGYGFLRRESRLFTRPILAVLAVCAGVCLLLVVKSRFRGPDRPKYDFAQLLPAYMCCVWLVCTYQVRAGDPVQQDYLYELSAIIACLLGLYYAAGFSFGRGKPFQTCLFSLLGVYCSLVTLADGHDLAGSLLYGFAILYPLSTTVALLHNAVPGGKRLLRPEGEPPEEDQETEGTPDES